MAVPHEAIHAAPCALQDRSGIGNPAPRTTRFLLLVLMATRKADIAASAFAGALNAIPAPLRQTLTCNQGKEMARHRDLAQATGMRVFLEPITKRGQPG